VRHNVVLTLLHKSAANADRAGRYWLAIDAAAPVGLALQSRFNLESTLTPRRNIPFTVASTIVPLRKVCGTASFDCLQ
jgi:hypothetical protein